MRSLKKGRNSSVASLSYNSLTSDTQYVTRVTLVEQNLSGFDTDSINKAMMIGIYLRL